MFTHLPEEMQFNWLKDLKRISKKGAYLFLTVENEKCNRYLNSKQLAELSNNGFYFYEGRLTEGLPDFYRMAFHSHDYVRNNWSKYFEIVQEEIVFLEGKGISQPGNFFLLRKI